MAEIKTEIVERRFTDRGIDGIRCYEGFDNFISNVTVRANQLHSTNIQFPDTHHAVIIYEEER